MPGLVLVKYGLVEFHRKVWYYKTAEQDKQNINFQLLQETETVELKKIKNEQFFF